MPSTISLIRQLKSDYPQFHFQKANRFLWSPSEHTVYYTSADSDYAFLLHELSHGLLGHAEYKRDVELIAMERAAWDKAVELAPNYSLTFSENLVENTLDSYRDWLHARSTCPNCKATGLQVKQREYTCPACRHNWRVNEARVCALRRFSI
jgi:ssDNA-binding Zn-finger/Zn-ribbon topoisomerase 1